MEGPSLRDSKSSPNYPFPLLENPSSKRQNYQTSNQRLGFPGGAVAKNQLAKAREVGDVGSIPGLKTSSEEENGNPLQYSCLENSMDGGAWRATVLGVTESQT